jgi:uncharacterized coiled-coil protein SlyX
MKELEARVTALESQIEILKKEIEASKMININRHEAIRILTDRTQSLNRDAQSEALGEQVHKILSGLFHNPDQKHGI